MRRYLVYFELLSKLSNWKKLIIRGKKIESIIRRYMGCSTETVAFQVYNILKTDYEFLQFF